MFIHTAIQTHRLLIDYRHAVLQLAIHESPYVNMYANAIMLIFHKTEQASDCLMLRLVFLKHAIE